MAYGDSDGVWWQRWAVCTVTVASRREQWLTLWRWGSFRVEGVVCGVRDSRRRELGLSSRGDETLRVRRVCVPAAGEHKTPALPDMGLLDHTCSPTEA